MVPAGAANHNYIVEMKGCIDSYIITKMLKEITEDDHDKLVEKPPYRHETRIKKKEMDLISNQEGSQDLPSRSWEDIKDIRSSTSEKRGQEGSYDPDTASAEDPRDNKNDLLGGHL